MSNAGRPDVCERNIRQALRHIRRAYVLVAGLDGLTSDEVGSVVVQEDIKAAFNAVREYGYHQFNVEVEKKGRG